MIRIRALRRPRAAPPRPPAPPPRLACIPRPGSHAARFAARHPHADGAHAAWFAWDRGAPYSWSHVW